MRGRPLQLCAQRVFVKKGTATECVVRDCKKGTATECAIRDCKKELQLSAQLDLKDGSAAECADQKCCFVRSGIKVQFCGRSPYAGGEPCYILCCGSFVLFLL